MKRLMMISAVLTPVLALALPARAAAQYPGLPTSGFYGGQGWAGPGYLGPGAVGPGYIGPPGPFAPTPRPTFSPYLELLRGGSPAVNYFLGTVPDLQAQAQAARFVLPPGLGAAQPGPVTYIDDLLPTLPQTGHPTVFGNYGAYYGTLNPGGRRAPMLNPFAATRR
jgi:hypothetical protein